MESSTATSSAVFEPQPTTQSQLDRVVARLKEGARKFVMLSLDHRMQLARAMQEGYLRVARPSVEAACTAKGIAAGSPMEGEEWTLGPWFVVPRVVDPEQQPAPAQLQPRGQVAAARVAGPQAAVGEA